MAERAGRSLDARNLCRFGMTAEDRIAAAEGIERLVGNETLFGQHHVLRDAAVTLAQDHAIPARPLRLFGPVAQDVVVEHAHDFDERQRGTDVAAFAAVQGTNDEPAQVLWNARRAAGSLN